MLALPHRVEADVFSEFPPVSLRPDQSLHVLPISGTLGTGVEYRHNLSDSLKWRFAYHAMDESRSEIRRSVNYDFNLEMFSHPLILDWHPFGGRFRASTGVVLGGASVRGTARSVDFITNNGGTISASEAHQAVSGIDPTQVVSIGPWSMNGADLIQYAATINHNQSLTANGGTINANDLGFVSAAVRYPELAPYFGFGWGNTDGVKTNWLYSIDVGVMYLGRPTVELALNGPVAEAAEKYFPTETQAYLSEEQRKLEDALLKRRYFPVFSISLWYRF